MSSIKKIALSEPLVDSVDNKQVVTDKVVIMVCSQDIKQDHTNVSSNK